jgi:hypothetical protein
VAIFEPQKAPHHWQPTTLAAGPFAGLQGGAVASLLTAEIERLAGPRNWGTAIAASAWFLRPTPMAELRTQLSVLSEGGRVSVIDNTLWAAGDDQPCATVRVTPSRERAVDTRLCRRGGEAADPLRFPVRTVRPPTAGPVHGRHGSARRRRCRLVPS